MYMNNFRRFIVLMALALTLLVGSFTAPALAQGVSAQQEAIKIPVEQVDVDPTWGDPKHDSGTWMKAKIYKKPTSGNTSTTPPNWWNEFRNKASTKTRNYISDHFVQAHLLSAELGGPGVRKNLIPATKSANTLHNTKVEELVKKIVVNDVFDHIEYHVAASYDKELSFEELGLKDLDTEEKKNITEYRKNFPYCFHAEYTVWEKDPKTGKVEGNKEKFTSWDFFISNTGRGTCPASVPGD